jgi:hypothetical protein
MNFVTNFLGSDFSISRLRRLSSRAWSRLDPMFGATGLIPAASAQYCDLPFHAILAEAWPRHVPSFTPPGP